MQELFYRPCQIDLMAVMFWRFQPDKFTDMANLDVSVDFTLLDRQVMTTHYSDEFNALIQSSQIGSSLIDIDANVGDNAFDVYTPLGQTVMLNADRMSIAKLSPGIYIIKSKTETRKIIVK